MKKISMAALCLTGVLSGVLPFSTAQSFAQPKEGEKEAIIELINKVYVGAVHNNIDMDVVKKGFHETFTWQWTHHDRFFVTTLEQWIKSLDREKLLRPDWHDKTTADINAIGLE